MPIAIERKLFGQSLVDKGVVSDEELKTALNQQKTSREKIGKILIDLGALSESDLVQSLSEHLRIPFITGEAFPSVPILENTFALKFMKHCRFLPVSLEQGELTVAMADPLDTATLDSIRLYSGYSNLKVLLAAESEVVDLVEKFYGNQSTTFGRIIEGMEDGSETFADENEDVEHLKDMASEAPVIRLVNLIMSRAVESRASDIHIEPFEKELKVRYRVDGILHDVESPPKRLKAAVISRVKIMARLNIAERRIPQDGRLSVNANGKK
ncbi:MAG: GspE/PulE family protein, partial [Acidobacteriota bacterium]